MRVCVILSILFFGQFLSTQQGPLTGNFNVLVLDALNGKPESNVTVDHYCIGPPENSGPFETKTDQNGLTVVHTSCLEQQKIELSIMPQGKKEQCGGDAGFALKDVLSSGFLSHPDSAGGIWCPTKISKTMKSVPGQATVFIKKPTWYQSHFAG